MPVSVADAVRRVTDDEVAFYQENGWVKLDGLISPELAGEMLTVARDVMGELPVGSDEVLIGAKVGDHRRMNEALHRKGGLGGRRGVVDVAWWQDYHYIALKDRLEPFYSYSFSRKMGENAQRLMDRDVPIRYYEDFVACKTSVGQPGSGATIWHQDLPTLPLDRTGGLTVWLALKDLPPESGTLRFLSGAFREGPLGRGRSLDMMGTYPQLRRYPTSPPFHLRPGDASVHGVLTPHGAPENGTDTQRWGFATLYIPADALFNGAPTAKVEGTGIEPFQPFDHPNFPIVYP